MSADPIRVGDTSTTSIPHSSARAPISRHAHSRSAEVIPPGSGVPVPGANAGSSTSTSTRQEDRPGADDRRRRARRRRGCRRSRMSCMKKLVMPRSCCQRELGLARPVAAQADLDVARRVDPALLDEPVHDRAVRQRRAEHRLAGVGVRVEVDQADRPAAAGDRADVGLGDRVIAAEHDRQRARVDDLAHQGLDRLVRLDRLGRQHGRVAEVDHPQHGEGVHPGLEVRPGRARRGADRARPEARPRAVADEIIGGSADDRDVDARQLGGVLRVGHAADRSTAPRSPASRRTRASARADRSPPGRYGATRGCAGRRRPRRAASC